MMPTTREVFLNEFVEKNLIEREDCERYYAAMTADQMMTGELSFLASDEVRGIAWNFAQGRYIAFFRRLLELASGERDLSDNQRAMMVRVCIDLKDLIRGKMPDDKRLPFDNAIDADCKRFELFSLFPMVSLLVRDGDTAFKGPFEGSPIGEVLERKKN